MPLLVPLSGSRATTPSFVAVPVAEAVGLGLGEAEAIRGPIVLESLRVGMTDAAAVLTRQFQLTDGIPLPVVDAATWSGDIAWIQTATLPLQLLERPDLTGVAPVGLDTWPVAVTEAPFAGLQESWTGIPDTLADVNGRHTWSRPVGTKWSVRGERAMLAGETTGEGFQVARCATVVGTSDYEVQATAIHQVNDAALVVTAVLARVDALAQTFYQFRVIDWGGTQMVDCWRNTVAIPWTRLAGPFYRAIPPGVRLRLRVIGSGPVTLTGWLDDQLIFGPLDDGADAITSGENIGIFADWSSGTQAQVGLDDVRVLAIGAGGAPHEVPVADAPAVAFGERLAFLRGWPVGEALSVRIAEWPVPTFFSIPGSDLLPVGVGEAAPLTVRPQETDVVAVDLGEGAEATAWQGLDTFGIQWGERGEPMLFPTSADLSGIGLRERGTALDNLIRLDAGGTTVAVAVVAGASVAVLTSGFISLIRSAGDATQVAGPTGERVTVAGPVNETVTGGL